MTERTFVTNPTVLNADAMDDQTTGLKVQRLHSQLLKINDQGISIYIQGDVAALDKIAAQTRDNGYFQMPAGSTTLLADSDGLKVGNLLIMSDTPSVLERM